MRKVLSILLVLALVLGMGITALAVDDDASVSVAAVDPQYNYNETAASKVTVNVTVSNDGVPIMGQEGTPISHLDVTVPYFDLSLYGLSTYYRYGTTGGKGAYTNTKLIERPTALHLFIYMIERYYMGLPAKDCGKGTSGI
ncbi:MAG: hypothetical protein IJ072_07555, partial [Oscillospiraceae bacterium]|nr:hypothetical protein [Oscillospiraceae bacterium]